MATSRPEGGHRNQSAERRTIETPAASADYERLLLQNLPLIDQVVGWIARRNHLSRFEAEDLAGAVRLKVFDNDYELLRRFENRSSLRTYLLVIAHRVFLDGRAAEWGRWRPSRESVRRGSVAVLLERLITRDGVSFDAACEILQKDHGVTASSTELYDLSLTFRPRASRWFVGEDELSDMPAVDSAAQLMEEHAVRSRAGGIQAALERALRRLPSGDCLLLRLRFQDGLTVAEVSRVLHVEQKPLYRRLSKVLAVLREELEASGMNRQDVLGMLGHPAFELATVV